MMAIQKIRQDTNCSIAQAKAVITHVAKQYTCHHCHMEIKMDSFAECDNCKALNINLD